MSFFDAKLPAACYRKDYATKYIFVKNKRRFDFEEVSHKQIMSFFDAKLPAACYRKDYATNFVLLKINVALILRKFLCGKSYYFSMRNFLQHAIFF